MRSLATVLLAVALSVSGTALYAQQKPDRNTLVRNDRSRVLDDGFWIYNNVEKGLAEARRSGKPLLVIFRCIPCEACAQLDEQVVEKNPAVRKSLSNFICVRVVLANAMDLSRFQFDYDQSWVAFFMNGDGTIYGRYGTRSHQTESEEDVSLEGFLDTMTKVLALHERYPSVKAALASKTGVKVPVAVPEDFPLLKDRYTADLDYNGEVARSCIHCHQIGDAWHEWYRDLDEPIPAKILYPHPHPKILGLIMDPKTAVRVAKVEPNSWSAAAGVRAGDEIKQFAGQPVVSMADMQWVLHNADETANLPVVVERNGSQIHLTLALPSGWRETGDISWRSSSWPMRRMVLGGLRLKSLSEEEATAVGEEAGVGLRVDHVGQYSTAAAAKRAGFKLDDIIVEIDGQTKPMTESQLLAHLMRTKKIGDKTDVEVLRAGKRRTLQLPVQE